MIYYWVLFSLPVVGLLSPVYLSPRLRLSALAVLIMVAILLIGFRHEIGGDWLNYFSPDQARRLADKFDERTLGTDLKTLWPEALGAARA